MLKKIFGFLLIFFLAGSISAQAQNTMDSSIEMESVKDSLEQPGQASVPTELLREVPARQIRKYLKNPDYAYANDPAYWKKDPPQKPGTVNRILISPLFRWVIFCFVIGVVLYGMYQLGKENNFRWFTRIGKQNDLDTVVLNTDYEMDFESAIRKYQAERNYRLAVRYMYLRLIQTAREKGGIQFRDSSTNAEIAIAFGSNPRAAEFRFLARAYEYIFYGDFIPDQEKFNMLKNKFEQFQKSISV